MNDDGYPHKPLQSLSDSLPYEFTYMFKLAIDLPAKVTEVVLPDNKDIVIFAATLVNDDTFPIYPATELFRTANKNKTRPMRIFARKVD